MDRHDALSWRTTLALFWFVAFVESMGVSHVLAFAPLYLQDLGAQPSELPLWTAVISSGAFLVGFPLVPFWGVWAERYGRKLIIARSAYVEFVVLLLVGLSRTPLELAGSILLSGFQLGNTGVMYAALTSLAPRERVGFVLAVMGMASSVGFSLGPALAGPIADAVGLRPIYLADAGLSLLSALAVTLLLRERRSGVTSEISASRAAWEAVRGVFASPVIRLVFLVYILAVAARHTAAPFLPLRVQELYQGDSLATAIGLVVGGSALVGALVSPLAGAAGDRLGYARVLGWAAVLGIAGMLGLALAPGIALLALAALALGVCHSSISALCAALLATSTSRERRAPTLNLALLPLYVGGLIGPAFGAALASLGLRIVFVGAAAPLALALPLASRIRGRPAAVPSPAPDA